MGHPQQDDYIQLLDKHDNPCENFTYVDKWQFKLGDGLYIVRDTQGDDFAIARCHELDNAFYAGWQQVITATA